MRRITRVIFSILLAVACSLLAAGCSFQGNREQFWEEFSQNGDAGMQFLRDYAQAYCDRNAEYVAGCYLDEETAFQDVILLEKAGGGYTMGYSSPWPDEYTFLCQQERASGKISWAEIRYYAWTSDPHVSVWKEELRMTVTADGYRITESSVRFLDSIDTRKAFNEAYLCGDKYRFIDYEERGFVEAINAQAAACEEERNEVYRSPDTAAAWILNLTGGKGEAQNLSNGTAVVTYTFADDSSVMVPMKDANFNAQKNAADENGPAQEAAELREVWILDLDAWNAKAP